MSASSMNKLYLLNQSACHNHLHMMMVINDDVDDKHDSEDAPMIALMISTMMILMMMMLTTMMMMMMSMIKAISHIIRCIYIFKMNEPDRRRQRQAQRSD